MLAIILPAAMVPIALPRRAARAIGVGFLLLFGARMLVLMIVWRAWADDVAALRSVIAPVQPGDVVLTIRVPRGTAAHQWTALAAAGHLSDGTVTDTNLPALLLIEHRAWWPYLFDNRSQQPIATRQPFQALAERIDAAAAPLALVPELPLVTRVLVWGPAPPAEAIAAAGLRRVAGNAEASLYAVINQPPRRSPPSGR